MMFSNSGSTQTSYCTISTQLLQDPEPFQKSQETCFSQASRTSKTNILVILDAQVEDCEKLQKGVVPQAKVILLDRTEDGIEQITQALRKYTDLSEIHIISHGSPGCLQLGNTQLSLDTLKRYASQLQTWSVPSLILYGCNVAAGDAGVEFIEKLHQITGAKIAASANKTGDSALGGDWNLEVKTDEFKVSLALTSEAIAHYSSVLATPINSLGITPQNIDGTPAADQSYNAPDITGTEITYNFQRGEPNLRIINSFLDKDNAEFLAGSILNDFELRRVDNDNIEGNRQLLWFERDSQTAAELNLRPPLPTNILSGKELMEVALFDDVINRGTDNIFANTTTQSDQNINNIERVDYIATNGLTTSNTASDLDSVGFLILERGGNDKFKIAPILALDANGVPSEYGELVPIIEDEWGRDISFTLETSVLRSDNSDGLLQRSADVTPQFVGGVYVSYTDLRVVAGETFFGYSLFANDVNGTREQLVDFTNAAVFPTNTNEADGGLDLIAGGVVYSKVLVSISDATPVNEGEPATFTVSLEKATTTDVTVEYTTRDGTATADDDYTPITGTIRILAGNTTSDPITVDTLTDQIEEPDETFSVILSNTNQGFIGDTEGIGTIIDVPPTTTIGGSIFTDTNGNNTPDTEEPRLPNITVNLVDPTTGNPVVPAVVTDANGNYQFINVPPGTYNVVVDITDPDIPEGATLATPSISVEVSGNQPQPDINFGFTPANVPPVVNNPTATTRFGVPTDPIPLQITDLNENEDLTTIDLNLDEPGIQPTRPLEEGRFELQPLVENQPPTVIFTPAPGFPGQADPITINYTVQDDLEAVSDPGTIAVTVTPNQAPTADDVPPSSPTLNVNSIAIPLSTANFRDFDGTVETISFTLPTPAEGLLFLDGVAVTDATQVQDLTLDQLDNLTFQPNLAFAGNASFSYTVTDNDGDISNVANITIPIVPLSVPSFPDPVNLPPQAQDKTETITNDGSTSNLPQLIATDPDGTVEFLTIVELPPNGILFLNGEEITSLDQVSRLTAEQAGQLSFQPDPNFIGEASFTFTATDNDGAVSNIATVRLNVEEDAVVFPPNQPVDDGGCDCPPLPEFAGIDLPNRPSVIPNPSNVEQPIIGSATEDTLRGTLTDDEILASLETAVIIGFEGNDSVFGTTGDLLIFGDEGSDSLFGDFGNDTIIGTNGAGSGISVADVLEQDILYGNEGNDILQGGPGNDTIFSGEQDDFTFGGQDNDIILGDLGNDTLYGDQGDDSMLGDTVDEEEIEPERGLNGVLDLMWGGAGDDSMNGGRGNDTLSGGDGNDDVRGGKEDDLVYGEAGDDLLYGDLGNDHLCGDEGNDTIYGDINDNVNFADTPGQDTLCGGIGNDLMFGNQDNDRLCGGEDSDTLYGGLGEDTLYGELGDDWLFGDEGNDLLFGGSGSDRFLIFSNEGIDTIGDFQLGTDFIALGGGLTFDQLTFTQEGTSTILSLDGQQLAILNNIQVSALTESSFTALVN
jgi:Ca2+-binding RTX toxin-like protein